MLEVHGPAQVIPRLRIAAAGLPMAAEEQRMAVVVAADTGRS